MECIKEVTLRMRQRQPHSDEDCRTVGKKDRWLEDVFKTKNTSSRSNWRPAFKVNHKIAQTKAASFWKEEIVSIGNNARRVWKMVDNILDDAVSGAKPSFTPDDYHNVIDKKVVDVRTSTSSSDRTSLMDIYTSTQIVYFRASEHRWCYQVGWFDIN